METVITIVNSVVAWLFSVLVFRQYLERRKLYQLVWAIGLACFAVAATTEFLVVRSGAWSEGVYRAWYFFGAMLGVVYLGQGTVHLVTSRRFAAASLVVIALVTVAAAYVTYTAPVDFTRLAAPDEPSGKAYPSIGDAGFATPRAWTPLLNSYGTLWLVGGAAWSALQFARRRTSRNLVTGNVLIATGAVVVGVASTLNRFGVSGVQYIGEMIGIVLIFLGFLSVSKPTGLQERI